MAGAIVLHKSGADNDLLATMEEVMARKERPWSRGWIRVVGRWAAF